MDLVCLGEILIDLFPAELGRRLAEVSAFLPKPGGAPANVAVAAARLGKKSAFIGQAGDDIFGHRLREILAGEGVDVRGLRFDPDRRTTLAFIAMPDEHSAEFVFYRNPGADLGLLAEELDLALLASTRAFHCGSLSLVAEPARTATHTALRLARQAGALISFDVNYRPSLWQNPREALDCIWAVLPQVHLLKVNEKELELLTGGGDPDNAAPALLAKGPALIAVTFGAGGSYFFTAKASGYVPAFQVLTVDAIGCGDAFMAGLLCQLVSEDDWRSELSAEHLQQVFRYASAVGALTALKHGVIPALPTADEVSAFLRTQETGNRQ